MRQSLASLGRRCSTGPGLYRQRSALPDTVLTWQAMQGNATHGLSGTGLACRFEAGMAGRSAEPIGFAGTGSTWQARLCKDRPVSSLCGMAGRAGRSAAQSGTARRGRRATIGLAGRARRVMALQRPSGLVSFWQGRPGSARHGSARRVQEWTDPAGATGQVSARPVQAAFGMTWQARHDSTQKRASGPHAYWHDMAGTGSPGHAWLGSVRLGTAGLTRRGCHAISRLGSA